MILDHIFQHLGIFWGVSMVQWRHATGIFGMETPSSVSPSWDRNSNAQELPQEPEPKAEAPTQPRLEALEAEPQSPAAPPTAQAEMGLWMSLGGCGKWCDFLRPSNGGTVGRHRLHKPSRWLLTYFGMYIVFNEISKSPRLIERKTWMGLRTPLGVYSWFPEKNQTWASRLPMVSIGDWHGVAFSPLPQAASTETAMERHEDACQHFSPKKEIVLARHILIYTMQSIHIIYPTRNDRKWQWVELLTQPPGQISRWDSCGDTHQVVTGPHTFSIDLGNGHSFGGFLK